MFDRPRFWEIVGGLVILVSVGPFLLWGCFLLKSIINDWATRLRGLTTLEDPDFGWLRFHSNGQWEGSVFFNPVQREIVVGIDASESGPSESQRSLWRELESGFDVLNPLISIALAPLVTECCGHDKYSLELTGIAFSGDSENGMWEASFEADVMDDGDMSYSVCLINGKVVSIDAGD